MLLEGRAAGAHFLRTGPGTLGVRTMTAGTSTGPAVGTAGLTSRLVPGGRVGREEESRNQMNQSAVRRETSVGDGS